MVLNPCTDARKTRTPRHIFSSVLLSFSYKGGNQTDLLCLVYSLEDLAKQAAEQTLKKQRAKEKRLEVQTDDVYNPFGRGGCGAPVPDAKEL